MYSSSGVVDYINYWKPYLVEFDASASFWPSLGDTVFDCGACIGENSILFASLVGASGSVNAFDPTPIHQDVLQFQISLNRHLGINLTVEPVPYAVGANTKDVMVDMPSNEMTSINPGPIALNKFKMVSLDDYSTANAVIPSYIKMDIEGFEIDALVGAARTISTNRPRLAISGYHKLEHLWEIPSLIKKLSDKYRIYLAHHSPTTWETVFYATST
jgi:FkbM family methyltransferase